MTNELIDVAAIEEMGKKIIDPKKLDDVTKKASDVVTSNTAVNSPAFVLDETTIEKIARQAVEILNNEAAEVKSLNKPAPEIPVEPHPVPVIKPSPEAGMESPKRGSTANLVNYKYSEDVILSEFKAYLDSTYGLHYKSNDNQIECFDAWIALGDATPTFRNTAMKYLWRYGRKGGVDTREDLFKALHYILMCIYNDHYKV